MNARGVSPAAIAYSRYTITREVTRGSPYRCYLLGGLELAAMRKLIQVSIVAGFVYWNMLAGWTANMYLPVLIGVMVAFVLSEICFDFINSTVFSARSRSNSFILRYSLSTIASTSVSSSFTAHLNRRKT